jgi:hypothetical protein
MRWLAAIGGMCLVGGIAWLAGLRPTQHKITDQELLREALGEWKLAGQPGRGPNPQIFEQQAAQGYYDDARATARLFKDTDELRWLIIELVKIRSENDDIQGAKEMIRQFRGSDLGAKATEEIALAQVHSGDLQGALDTAAPVGVSDQVTLEFARYQIANADFDGALTTAQQLKSGSAAQVFYEVGDALRLRGEQKRARTLAAHMGNRKLAALFLECAKFTLWERGDVRTVQPTSCDLAYFSASAGRFAEADVLIRQNKCPNVSFVTTQQYSVDPGGAERLLRGSANPQDLDRGIAEFAVAAAQKGDIPDALRFLDEIQRRDGPQSGTEAVHQVARAWTIKDGPRKVLKWARRRPTYEQRTWALIGMAEALGHARQGHPGPTGGPSPTREAPAS